MGRSSSDKLGCDKKVASGRSSTMAEGVFRSIVEKPPYNEIIGKVDSCGTGRVSHVLLFVTLTLS